MLWKRQIMLWERQIIGKGVYITAHVRKMELLWVVLSIDLLIDLG